MSEVIYTVVNQFGSRYASNQFNGFYPTPESAKRASERISRIPRWWHSDRDKLAEGELFTWRVQAARVEWYDVS